MTYSLFDWGADVGSPEVAAGFVGEGRLAGVTLTAGEGDEATEPEDDVSWLVEVVAILVVTGPFGVTPWLSEGFVTGFETFCADKGEVGELDVASLFSYSDWCEDQFLSPVHLTIQSQI